MLWVAAPPSDHDENVYGVPLSVWDGGALIEFADLAMTVRVNGVTALSLPTVSVSPDGAEAKLRLAVCGSSRTLVVELTLLEFVAVS